MQILDELREAYQWQPSETVEGWLTRLVRDFLNLDHVPVDKPLVAMGSSSLSAAILIDLIKKETGATLVLEQAMGAASISSIEAAIMASPTTFDVIKQVRNQAA